jgi:hypothetical protein
MILTARLLMVGPNAITVRERDGTRRHLRATFETTRALLRQHGDVTLRISVGADGAWWAEVAG